MKILLVHNDYGKYSGEEAVVDKMATMLGEHGHQVVQYRRSSAEIHGAVGKIKAFATGCYSPSGVAGMREVLRREKPDVVNVHNLYPLISPAALFECRRAGVPVVMTVHNFRLICPTGLFMRNNHPCELCLERGNEWGCIAHNCEHSLVKSAGYALRNAVARRTGAYRKCVTRFACITNFQRKKLIQFGYEPRRIVVIPNSVDYNAITTGSEEGNYVAFCGRISNEKGVDLIIDAARRHPDIPFKLAGAVRDKELVAQLPANVELLGYVSGNGLHEFYRNARFIVMASRCYEGFPMSILEAAQFSKCTIAPDHGGFTEIIGKGEEAIGRLFTPGDATSLEQQIEALWQAPNDSERLGRAANHKLLTTYSTEVVYRQWEKLLTSISGKI